MKLADGRKTVAAAGTAVQVGSSRSIASVAITALSTNTGTICVGSSTVKAAASERSGQPLSAGQTVALETDDLGDVYIDATLNGEGVSWLAVVEE